jgi:hypothetical protein
MSSCFHNACCFIDVQSLMCVLCAAAFTAVPVSPSQNAQQEKQLKAQRELFVGNLAPGVGEQSLYQVFHSALIAAFPQAGQPGQEPVLKVGLVQHACRGELIAGSVQHAHAWAVVGGGKAGQEPVLKVSLVCKMLVVRS